MSSAPANDVLGQTLQLLHAVYASDDGLRISELSRRFSLSPEHVRLIMDRLVSLEPMAESVRRDEPLSGPRAQGVRRLG